MIKALLNNVLLEFNKKAMSIVLNWKRENPEKEG
jgi:hypothetical protein